MLKLSLCIIFACAVLCASADSSAMTTNFKYKGTLYGVTVTASGALYGGRLGETPVFNSLSVVGNYDHPGEKFDARMFQENSKNMASVLETLGDNRFRITTKGTLGNEKSKDAAEYEQVTTLEPGRILIQYKITSGIPMMTHCTVFTGIMSMPVGAVVDRGIVLNEDKIISVPAKCEQGKGFRTGCGKLKISFPDGIFRVIAGWKTDLSLIDCRSWGETIFRLDSTARAPWTQKATSFPAGKVWEWTVEYSFLPYED